VYAGASDVELIVGMRMNGEHAGEWTLIFSDVELEAEEGREARPLVTLEGESEFWAPMRVELRRWLEIVESARNKGQINRLPDAYRLTTKRLNNLERVKGYINLTFREAPAGDVTARVYFNTFDEREGDGLNVSMLYADFLRALRGEITFKELGSDNRIDVSGDMGLPMKLMSAVV